MGGRTSEHRSGSSIGAAAEAGAAAVMVQLPRGCHLRRPQLDAKTQAQPRARPKEIVSLRNALCKRQSCKITLELYIEDKCMDFDLFTSLDSWTIEG